MVIASAIISIIASVSTLLVNCFLLWLALRDGGSGGKHRK